MRAKTTNVLPIALLALLVVGALPAQHEAEQKKEPGTPASDAAGADQATRAMSSRQVDMGPHMKMTTLRPPQAADARRAERVVGAARIALEKYRDVRVAEADGYRIFLPQVPQKMYHFTNYAYGFEAGMGFDPTRPTSLLYEKNGDEYRLVGAMYTAPARFSEEELHQRIPLSVAQWHAHVNLCLPPSEKRRQAWGRKPRFGLRGSIATREECEAEDGWFIPQVFGWMVHMYPFETAAEKIWSLEPQKPGKEHSHSH